MDQPVASATTDVAMWTDYLFQRAREHRRAQLQRWVRAWALLHGRTWSQAREAWMPSPELPELYPVVSSMVSWIADSRPTYEVAPYDPDMSDYAKFMAILADDLQATMQAAWEVNNYSSELETALWDGFTYGIGYLKIGWDATLAGGLGDVVQKRVDPFTLYLDPAARRWDQVNYMTEVANITVLELDRRFPGAAAKLDASGAWRDAVQQAPTQLDDSGMAGPRMALPGNVPDSSTPTRWGITSNPRMGQLSEDDTVTVRETWVRRHGRKDGRLIDAWRCIVTVGNTVLFDHPAVDMWEHGQHPYARYVPNDTGDIYSDSLVLLLASAQISINRILAALEQNMWLTGNPVLLEDNNSGITRQRVHNKPGQRLSKTPGSAVQWLNPPQVQPQIASSILGFFKGEIENISGLSSINRGFVPTGRNAQGVLDSVQEAGFGRVRAAQRQLEVTLGESGSKVASLITEFYDEPRLIAYGVDDSTQVRALQSNHFYKSPTAELPMRFRVKVVAGSQLPTSPSARANLALTLAGMGYLDQEAVLEILRIPGRRKIVERTRQLQAAGLQTAPTARQRTRGGS